jgi:protein involved in polysaccharide export with SLBB domain
MSLRFLPVACWLMVCAACHPPSTTSDRPSVPPPAPGSTTTTLGASDMMEVRVFQEADFSGIYRVGSDGSIDFPYCHKLEVRGRTPSEAAQKITDCLKPRYLVNPQVSVELKEYNSKRISVFGEIPKPGTFPYTADLTAVQAILLAGGFNKTASKNAVILVRPTETSEARYKVAIEDIAAGRAPNVLLQPGDILYVPESFF